MLLCGGITSPVPHSALSQESAVFAAVIRSIPCSHPVFARCQLHFHSSQQSLRPSSENIRLPARRHVHSSMRKYNSNPSRHKRCSIAMIRVLYLLDSNSFYTSDQPIISTPGTCDPRCGFKQCFMGPTLGSLR